MYRFSVYKGNGQVMEEQYNKAYIKELAHKWRAGTLSGDERELLERWDKSQPDEILKLEENSNPNEILNRLLIRVNTEIGKEQIQPAKVTRLWPRYAVAAAVIGMAIGVYFYSSRHLDTPSSREGRDLYANDIAPGKNNSATLTLADGKKILINNAASGQLAEQHGVSISKTADGQIVYELKDKGTAGGYNTLQTTNGEQTAVRLQDGSVVKLNAASTLTYPASFAGLKERRVKLKGEGYFIAAHNAKQPFRVESKGQVVEDIGTEFNINAYSDDGTIKTTLIEGIASVASLAPLGRDAGGREGKVILKPNQQAVLAENNTIKVKQVDVNDVIDWKNDEFIFRNEPLDQIMRRVARWYNIEVIYSNDVNPKQTFGGRVSRKLNISEVLGNMQATGKVKFKIEGRKVYVNK